MSTKNSGLARAFRLGGLVDDRASDEVVQELARVALAFSDGAFIAAQIDPAGAGLPRMFSIFYAGVSAALASKACRGPGPSPSIHRPRGART